MKSRKSQSISMRCKDEGYSVTGMYKNRNRINYSAHNSPISSPRLESKVKPFPASTSMHLNPARRLLFNRLVKFHEKDYLIEISRTKTQVFIIAWNCKTKEMSGEFLTFTEKQMFKLLYEANNSFESLTERLYLDPLT